MIEKLAHKNHIVCCKLDSIAKLYIDLTNTHCGNEQKNRIIDNSIKRFCKYVKIMHTIQ